MPEHHRQRKVQSHGQPHGVLKGRVVHFVGGDWRAHEVDAGKQSAIDQGRDAHHGNKAKGIQAAQHQHVFHPSFAAAKSHQQNARHGELALFCHSGGGHQSQSHGGQQHQCQHIAHERNHGGYRDPGHEQKEQARHGQRLLPESTNTLAHPDEAGAGCHDVQFHSVLFKKEFHSARGCATRARSTRSKWVGSCGVSMAASRGR